MNLEHIVLVLQMSIGPMIVSSGAGLVLLSMTNRFGRVIDRVRIFADFSPLSLAWGPTCGILV